ncbi:hypothetical protein [Streptomyces chattanoogensis]|uniref:hypothetical protein n=1 Tax=Streptomyces chattanoogensis TaxID=66876 RepID=UPI0036AA233F
MGRRAESGVSALTQVRWSATHRSTAPGRRGNPRACREGASSTHPGITLVAEGLEVHIPSVKDHPPSDVVAAYGNYADT